MAHAGRFFGRMIPPNFARGELLWKGLAESLQIAVLASALGIVLALPFGLLGARNLMPAWVSWPARLVDRARTLVPSGRRRDPVRQGGGLRCARRHSGARPSHRSVSSASSSPRRSRRCRSSRWRRFARPARRSRRCWRSACCRRCSRASSASRRTSSIRTCATRRWWASSAPAASAARCSPRSSASITTSCPRSSFRSSR